MLSDDVNGAVGKTVSTTGAVVGGTVRGGLLGAAATFAAGALGIGAYAAAGAASAGIGAAATAAVTGTIAGAGLMLTGALPIVLAGAAIGAALLGIGALIPGVKDMWKGSKKLVHRDSQPAQTVEIQQNYPAPQVRRTIVYDNPDFEPGRGAKMMEKGDCAQSAHICR